MDESVIKELASAANAARANSYAPYSGFSVGAAVLCGSKKIYTGVNVENASYPVGLCAERSAFAAAVSAGEREFLAVAIAGGRKKEISPASPCGMCRQFMRELCPDDMTVIVVTAPQKYKLYTLQELLPESFVLADGE